MDRLFLDANNLFSAAYRPNAGQLQFWKLKNVVLCSSHNALEEARVNLTDDPQRRRLAKLAKTVHFYDAAPRAIPRGISLPEKDLPILFAAIEARATHLITGDIRLFGAYFGKKIQGLLILAPASYLEIVRRP